jgi:hypothetical protein
MDDVKRICQDWVDDGRGEDCFWEGWPECPTPQDSLTPKMVLDRLAEVAALRARLADVEKEKAKQISAISYIAGEWKTRAERAEAALATARRDAFDAMQHVMDYSNDPHLVRWARMNIRALIAQDKQ